MIDKKLTLQTRAMTMPLTMNFTSPKKYHDTNKTNDEKNDEPTKDADDTSTISYIKEDNEDTEPMIEKTYQDDLIPLQHELLNTKIAEPIITQIPKQEIDYHPKIVLTIPNDPQAKQLTLLQALVDSRSNKCHAKLSKMPK
jgi:hypothetical protein